MRYRSPSKLFFAATYCLNVVLANYKLPNPYGWACIDERCVKELDNVNNPSLTSLNTCKLTCGRYSGLWPQPTGYTFIKNQTVSFDLSRLILEPVNAPTSEVEQLTEQAFEIFRSNVAFLIPAQENGPYDEIYDLKIQNWTISVKINIFNTGTDTRLSLETSEEYSLSINTDDENQQTNVTIRSPNFFGVRHALETLSQLVGYDDTKGVLEIPSSVGIVDKPAFRYRGILLDTARNFLSVEAIERTLDALSANKLNTLHWHITDSSSFPMYLDNIPEMTYYGAFDKRLIYSPTDIKRLVEYGRVRGIRVLPEFAAPGHLGNGWQWTEQKGLGQLALCVDKKPWQSYCSEPPCGQLNIVNDKAYEVLSLIYKEMVNAFGPLDLFHFGGDEVNLNCWNSTDEIVTYLAEMGMDRSPESFLNLWKDFQSRAYDNFTASNNGSEIPGILWTSQLTDVEKIDRYLNASRFIIQIKDNTDERLTHELLKKGFRVILSNQDAWSLDCGFGSWSEKIGNSRHSCGSYQRWQTVYDNSPHAIAQTPNGVGNSHLILGGEGILWGHQVDDASLDVKLWPRGSALAERLWTNPNHNWQLAETRFVHHRQRMFQRGINADRIQPQWCYQNEEIC